MKITNSVVNVDLNYNRILFRFIYNSRYGWKKISLVYNVNDYEEVSGRQTSQLMMKSLVKFLKNENFIYGSYDLDKNKDETVKDNLRRELGHEYSSKYRVKCVKTTYIDVVKLMLIHVSMLSQKFLDWQYWCSGYNCHVHI